MKQTSLILILVLTTTTYAFAPSYTCKMTSSSLFSTPEDEEPTELILGSENFSEAFINKYLSENILDINPELL